jgi:signal transduction histidine kinase/HAMP domain-containing protein
MLFNSSKSRTAWLLIGFFSAVALGGMAMILTNAIIHYHRLFAPWQDFWILAGGVALAHLAYSLPQYERSLEERVVTGAVGFLAVLALVYCIVFDYRFLYQWTPGLSVNDAYYLLLPIGILLVVIVFLRRSILVSTRHVAELDQAGRRSSWRHLLDPQGGHARLYRNMALGLSMAFLPAIQTLVHFPGIYGFILSNVGSLLAIITLALVYFNYATEMSSFVPKLVGITLATITFIFTFVGIVDALLVQKQMTDERFDVIASIHDGLVKEDELAYRSSHVAYVAGWEAAIPKNEAGYRLLYLSSEESTFDLERLIADNQKGYLDEWSVPDNNLENITVRLMQRYWVYPLGSGQPDYWGYIFVHDGTAFEVGFSKTEYDNAINRVVTKWLVVFLISSLFVLLVFPLFFRRILVKPLENLLQGIRHVNSGELETVVTPSFSDEVGLLTESFNRMVNSLNDARDIIQNRALDLEVEVSQRSIDLININVQLEKENKEREIAEARINKQLRYQKALAACSQSLLDAPEPADETGRQRVLGNALEYLRSGVGASRAYVTRYYVDTEHIRRLAIFAETCESGIFPHISNPANQRFPLSELPPDLVDNLESGKPVGGPSEQVFSGHPFAEILLQQDPPLLSLLLFPIHLEQNWWGFVGFDDCVTPRVWGESEILVLRTASEIIGGTIQRWEVRGQLEATLADLERRVEDRTRSLNELNAQLQGEIATRHRFQLGLESRLNAERLLAKASARLAEAQDITVPFGEMLQDLGEIMKADSITMMIIDPVQPASSPQCFNWYHPARYPVDQRIIDILMEPAGWLYHQLPLGQPLFFRSLDQLPSGMKNLKEALVALKIESLILWPLVANEEVLGLLVFYNGISDEMKTADNIQSLEMFINLLSGMLERQRILRTLELRVTEQTRELSTLYELTLLAGASRAMSEILSPALSKIQELSRSDAVCIHIHSPEEEILQLVAHRGFPQPVVLGMGQIAIQGNFNDWLERPETDYTRGQVQSVDIPEQYRLSGFQTFVISKLHVAGMTKGVIACYRASAEAFTPFQTSMLTVIGKLLGVVVENHRLTRETEKLATVHERQRLARELHDAVSQSLYSLSLFARSASDAQESGDSVTLASCLEQLEEISLAALREMRLLLYQLRSIALVAGSLSEAVESRLNMVERRLGIDARFELDDRIFLTSTVEQELFRVITETLNNSLQHARATRISIVISLEQEQLVMTATDDGIGFDPSRIHSGMGLQNMRERAAALNGRMEIFSMPDQGTCIRLMIPYRHAQAVEGPHG